MLKLLLDEHIAPDVAEGLRRKAKDVDIQSLAEWQEGKLLGADDRTCLEEAMAHGFTFVTYDRRTIPPLLKAWAEEGRSHGGVIFVDEKTISPADIGGLVRSLQELWRKGRAWQWTDRVGFLRSRSSGRRSRS